MWLEFPEYLLFAFLAQISTEYLTLQDKVHKSVRFLRFEGMSRISVFVSELAQMCVCLCAVLLVCVFVCVCLLFKCLVLLFLWSHLLDSSLVFTAFPLKGAANDRKVSSSCQGRKAGEDRGGKRVISEGWARGEGRRGGGGVVAVVLNLEQLMKGIVTQISPVSSLLSW